MSLPSLRLSELSCLVLAASALWPLAGTAAPSTETPGSQETNPTPATPLGSTGLRPGAGNSDTRTIDLLVEMQQPTAGIQFNERAGRAPRDGQARSGQPAAGMAPVQAAPQRPQMEMPPTPPSGLFGSGATPTVQARSQNVAERSPSGDAPQARASGRPSSDVPPEVKRWLMWPREMLEYVRENRGFVAGCAAVVLLMAWTGSVMFSRRRG